MTPSSSPTTISPGCTNISPHMTGTLIPTVVNLGAGEPGKILLIKIGNPISEISTLSLTPPSITAPPNFLCIAARAVNPPQFALSVSPSAATTKISPAFPLSIIWCKDLLYSLKSSSPILWGFLMRFTVTAGPAIFSPGERGLMLEDMQPLFPTLSITSDRTLVLAFLRRSTISAWLSTIFLVAIVTPRPRQG